MTKNNALKCFASTLNKLWNAHLWPVAIITNGLVAFCSITRFEDVCVNFLSK